MGLQDDIQDVRHYLGCLRKDFRFVTSKQGLTHWYASVVFVTHGKDRALVGPIKRLLGYGELEPVVSVERSSVSKPVPEKVMDDMRLAGAAIIFVMPHSDIVHTGPIALRGCYAASLSLLESEGSDGERQGV
jgi:hypothetical protein